MVSQGFSVFLNVLFTMRKFIKREDACYPVI